KLEQADDLAKLLELYQDKIAASWAEKVHKNSSSRYGQVPLSELTASASRGLAAFIDGLKTGSAEAMDSYLTEVTLARLEAGFDISEVLEALLLVREAAFPDLLDAFSSEPTRAALVSSLFDSNLRYMATRFAFFYAKGVEQRLQEQQRQTRQLLETSESLQRVTSALLQKVVTLEEVLELVCTESQRLTGATGSAVLLVEDGDWLRVTSNSGTPSPILNRLAIGESLAGMVVAQGEPLLLNDPENQIQAYYREPDLKTLLSIPLWADESIIGALDVVNKPGGFNEEDIRIMSLFADQAAIAIKNAQLHERAEQLAVVEERQRLARGLHDSVTQVLYSVNLYAEAARMALSAGKAEIAAENLQELRNMAREAMLDMRMLIFELHPPALEEEGLASALQTRLEAVETRSGIQTEFQVEGDTRMPLAVEEELYHVAQEALNNAVKHARAEKVIVRLFTDCDHFCLEVQDDGRGFDLAAAGKSGGLGLHSIEERVQRINGELAIDSKLGEGTTLRVGVKT
ncbi:MAG: GAF domain-containing sensor histidine kinase, partial [Chloroflexota bacterium]